MALVADMKEYFGEETFEEWLTQSKTIGSILTRIKENFVLGGHKAAAIANLLEDMKIFVLSSMNEETIKDCFFIPLKNLAELENGNYETIYIIPYGGQTLPEVRGGKRKSVIQSVFASTPISVRQ